MLRRLLDWAVYELHQEWVRKGDAGNVLVGNLGGRGSLGRSKYKWQCNITLRSGRK
jgi:hypothetical protein